MLACVGKIYRSNATAEKACCTYCIVKAQEITALDDAVDVLDMLFWTLSAKQRKPGKKKDSGH